MSPVVFPITFDQLAASIEVRELSDRLSLKRALNVRAFPVQHPGGALGYRFTPNGNVAAESLVYISDNELSPAGIYESPATWQRDLIAFCRGAGVLVHDSMFTTEEYQQHVGWGHSTYEDAVALALEAEVERLVLFHHKPERTDDEVDRRTDECRALVAQRGGRLEILAAAEGLTLTV